MEENVLQQLMSVPRQTDAKLTNFSRYNSKLKCSANRLCSLLLNSVYLSPRTEVQLFPQSLHCGEVMLSGARLRVDAWL